MTRLPARIAAAMLVAVLAATHATAPAASACPMCKAGNEKSAAVSDVEAAEAQSRASAYMYSIFFMMSMPPLVLGGLVVAIRREMRKADESPLL